VAEDRLRAPGPQRVRVVDAVAPHERGHDERERLDADVRPARRGPEVDVPIEELPQAEVAGERGREQEARVGDEAGVVEGRGDPVLGVRRSHLTGVLSLWVMGWLNDPIFSGKRAPVACSAALHA